MRSQRPAGAGAFVVIALALSGCGDQTKGEVSGTVKVDGKLVAKGSIAFIPEDGKGPTEGATITNGLYSVRNVPVGRAKVAISKPAVIRMKKLYAHDPKSPEYPQSAESLPRKYSGLEETELRYDVTPGQNEKDFDLQTK